MRSKRKLPALLAILMVWSLFSGLSPAFGAHPAGLPAYLDPSRPVEERVADLLGRMTLDEKVGQMIQAERASTTPEDVRDYFLGSVFSGGGSFPNGKQSDSTRDNWIRMFNSYQDGALSTRLGIPLLYGVDAVHGHNNVIGATIFPHNIGLGATRNLELVEQIGSAVAKEVRATGVNWTFSPTIADPQNIKWGRTYEGFGDNQDLVGDMGAAFIRGLQGDTPGERKRTDKVVATAKHFIGEGLTDNGVNQGDITTLTEDEVLALNLPMYKKAVDAGARVIMASYNSIQGLKMHANKRLLTDVLKGNGPGGLGFTGFVVSDYDAVKQITRDWEGNPVSGLKDQIRVAVNAGVDMLMIPHDWKLAIRYLKELASENKIPMERIDDAVSRILRVKFEFGLFEHPKADPKLAGYLGAQSHRELARQAVRESLVLLKNDKVDGEPILSRLPKMKRIFVAGKSADDLGMQLGGWSITWQGQSGKTTEGTTILEGIRQAVGSSKTVTFNEHGRGAAGHDVAIVVIGEPPYAEGNGDNLNSLKLDDEDVATLRNVEEANIPTIVILISGRPMIINDYLDDWEGLIAAWLPGTEGQGVADVLFGPYDFKGKLPIRWPFWTEAYKPLVAGEKNLDEPYILFDYGYGLTKNEETPALKPVPANPGAPRYERVEAEHFIASSDVGLEDTSDEGGGQNVGWIDENDWLEYLIEVPEDGTFDVDFRYAANLSGTTGFKLLDSDGKELGSLTVQSTGGWQNWRTVTMPNVTLKAGIQKVKILFTGGSINLNWFGSPGFRPYKERVDHGAGYQPELPVLKEGAVEVWVTNERKPKSRDWYFAPQYEPGDKKLEKEPNLNLTIEDRNAGDDIPTIRIDPQKTYQSVLGIGSSMDESTVFNLRKMSEAKRNEVLAKLYSETDGIGMSLVRVTIGTADFTAQPFYTYDDMPPGQTDEDLSEFSIQKDIDLGIIDALKKAKELNPNLKFFASPWSPPGWMKTSGSMIGGQVKDEYLPVLAKYYVKFIQEYKKQGIDIEAMTLQNEPLLEIDYPSTKMPWQQQKELAKLLKKELEAAGLGHVKLWIFDHNPSDTMTYPVPLLDALRREGPEAYAVVDGTAFHDYGGELSMMSKLKELHPEKHVYLTERAVWGTEGADRIAQYFRNWARSYNSWVVMLDSDIKTHQWVGTPDPTLLIQDSADRDNYWMTPEYYILGHYTKFVKPGYVRVDSNYSPSPDVTNVTFMSPDESTLVTVVINRSDSPQTFRIVSEGTQFVATLDAKSVATYRWNRIRAQEVPGSVRAVDFTEAEGSYKINRDNPDSPYIDYINQDDAVSEPATFHYAIDVKKDGAYYFDFEYATENPGDRKFTVKVDDQEVLSGVNLPQPTYGWDNFSAHRVRVNLTSGLHKLTVVVEGKDINFAGFTLTPVQDETAVPGLLEAEQFTSASGVLVQQEGRTIGYLDAGDEMRYAVNVPVSRAYPVTLRYASANDESRIEFASGDQTSEVVLQGTGDWDKWQTVTGSVYLDAGASELTVRVLEGGANLDWFAFGPVLQVSGNGLQEGAVDGGQLEVQLLNGTFADPLNASNWSVEGLDGVSVASVNRAGDQSAVLQLSGTEMADTDSDLEFTVTASVYEMASGSDYGDFGIIRSNRVVLIAEDDEETLSAVPERIPYDEVEGAVIRLQLEGGTFVPDHVQDITLSGDAATKGYVSISNIAYVSPTEVDIALTWNGTPYYGDLPLIIRVPAAAYRDSAGGGTLETTVTLEGTAKHADPIDLSATGTLPLDQYFRLHGVEEDNGVLRAFEAGDWVEYRLNVPESGDYTVNLKVQYTSGGFEGIVLESDDRTLAKISVQSNSAAWMGTRATVYLDQGVRTFRIKVNAGSLTLGGVEIVPRAAIAIGEDPVVLEAENYHQGTKFVIEYQQGQPSHIGYTNPDDWLEYLVDVDRAGVYKVTYRYATTQSGVSVRLTAGGQSVVTPLPATGGWGNYTEQTALVRLSAGVQTIRFTILGDGANFDWFGIEPYDGELLEGQVATPTAYRIGNKVYLVTATAGAKIYYTTDGSLPTADSNEYTGPITVGDSFLIRAIAVKPGMYDSFAGWFNAVVTPEGEPQPKPQPQPQTPGTAAPEPESDDREAEADPELLLPEPVLDPGTGLASIAVDPAALQKALDQADERNGVKTVILKIPETEPEAVGADGWLINLPAEYVSGKSGIRIQLAASRFTVTVPGNMIPEASLNGAKLAGISIVAAGAEAVPDEVKSSVGNRPVCKFGLYLDGQPVIWFNPDAAVTVRLAYQPDALEDPEHLVILQIDDHGHVTPVPNGYYDPDSGHAVFRTNGFATFAVAYVHKTFKDLGNHAWAQRAIEVLASRGVIKGVSDTAFQPQSNIKRADFILLLVRALGLSATVADSFDDVKPDAYYHEAVAIAKRLGIARGVGGNLFRPDQAITRQEMMVLVERALKAAGQPPAAGDPAVLEAFTDRSQIADYAVNSVASMVRQGWITGSAGKLRPLDPASRAEVAVLLYRILKP